MKYVENDGQVTNEYEVKIDTQKLEAIIKELTAKCYRMVSNKTKVAANNKEEAIEKINAMDRKGVTVNELVDVSSAYPSETKNTGLRIFDCEYSCKQNTYLVYILETILSNYNSNLEFKNQNYRFIDLLIQFGNSDELKSYEEKLTMYREELLKVKENNSDPNVAAYQRYLEEKVDSVLREMDYNKNYDFALLKELYERAKECFRLILVSETIHYRSNDKNSRVYKLGTTKRI